jgi:hypothetical protein
MWVASYPIIRRYKTEDYESSTEDLSRLDERKEDYVRAWLCISSQLGHC